MTPGYFNAVGLEILRGRGFEENDRWGDRRDPGRPKRIMIKHRLAKLIFPNGDAKWESRFSSGRVRETCSAK